VRENSTGWLASAFLRFAVYGILGTYRVDLESDQPHFYVAM